MTKKRKKNVKLTNHKEDSELFKLTNQMGEPNTFTQIVTINLGNIKMILIARYLSDRACR